MKIKYKVSFGAHNTFYVDGTEGQIGFTSHIWVVGGSVSMGGQDLDFRVDVFPPSTNIGQVKLE